MAVLNGFHSGCESEGKCGVEDSKGQGLKIVFTEDAGGEGG